MLTRMTWCTDVYWHVLASPYTHWYVLTSLCSKNAKVWMEGWVSKIHIACERGLCVDIKKQSIFQICREKFWTNFREILDRVSPCPSTWHKYQKIWEKFLLKSPFSGHLKSKRFLTNKAGFNTSSIFQLLDCNESLQKTRKIFKH